MKNEGASGTKSNERHEQNLTIHPISSNLQLNYNGQLIRQVKTLLLKIMDGSDSPFL